MLMKDCYKQERLTFKKTGTGWFLFGVFALSIMAGSFTFAQTSKGTRYDQLFNCMCEVEVKPNGEVDMSKNCGRNLADCSCSFAKKMKSRLRKLDRQNVGKKGQIRSIKSQYEQYGSRVLAVPDPTREGTSFLGYVIPPAIIFLGLLFVGSIGWYWLADPTVSREDGEGKGPVNTEETEGSMQNLDEQIEREVEQRRRDS